MPANQKNPECCLCNKKVNKGQKKVVPNAASCLHTRHYKCIEEAPEWMNGCGKTPRPDPEENGAPILQQSISNPYAIEAHTSDDELLSQKEKEPEPEPMEEEPADAPSVPHTIPASVELKISATNANLNPEKVSTAPEQQPQPQLTEQQKKEAYEKWRNQTIIHNGVPAAKSDLPFKAAHLTAQGEEFKKRTEKSVKSQSTMAWHKKNRGKFTQKLINEAIANELKDNHPKQYKRLVHLQHFIGETCRKLLESNKLFPYIESEGSADSCDSDSGEEGKPRTKDLPPLKF